MKFLHPDFFFVSFIEELLLVVQACMVVFVVVKGLVVAPLCWVVRSPGVLS